MTAPKDTLWPAEPHTLAKHAILKEYLKAWFPILTLGGHPRVIYYDGFAGPGKYSGGEDGSPVIAVRAALTTRFPPGTQLVFRFVEADAKSASHLEGLLEGFHLPANYDCKVVRASFDDAIQDDLKKNTFTRTPTFAFIDPFGYADVPFDLIRQILQNRNSEVLITFMKGFVARFPKVTPEAINNTIGNASAAEELRPLEWKPRLERARLLYHRSLSEVAKFVRFFEMSNEKNVPIYDLFFASNHSNGHWKMKEAMWKVDASGEFRFSDGVDLDQLTLFKQDPTPRLATVLSQRFSGTTVHAEEVITYARDYTVYVDKHTKAALKQLERSDSKPRIQVSPKQVDGKPHKKGTFPDGTVIMFPD